MSECYEHFTYIMGVYISKVYFVHFLPGILHK